MDNITHSLVGIALADVSLGAKPARTDRRLATGAGIVAANLPDIDLVYSGIAPQPLGYLLHHRGHTHTALGLIALMGLLMLAYRGVTPARKIKTTDRLRLWGLILVSLGSHLLLDSLNSYGVHPFHPIDSRWYFGDTLFIFEPSLWLFLGIAVAGSARSRAARISVALPVAIVPFALASMAIIPPEGAASLALVGFWFAWISFRLSPRWRAVAALTACMAIIAGLSGASRTARRAVEEALQSERQGRLLDIILTPNPASPLCWAAIGIELNEPRGEYVLWRGTVSLAPQWKAPTSCASHRLTGARELKSLGRGGGFALRDAIRQPLRRLREHAERDCWVRAWLRFGRAPVITGNAIFDLRFAERLGRNFTHMPLASGPRDCPPYLPNWAMPREDLLLAASR